MTFTGRDAASARRAQIFQSPVFAIGPGTTAKNLLKTPLRRVAAEIVKACLIHKPLCTYRRGACEAVVVMLQNWPRRGPAGLLDLRSGIIPNGDRVIAPRVLPAACKQSPFRDPGQAITL